LQMKEVELFTTFMQDLRSMVDLPEALPSLVTLECPICLEDFTVDGLRMPKLLMCAWCRRASGVDKFIYKLILLFHPHPSLQEARCPSCRRPLNMETDLKCIEKVKYRQKILDALLAVEPEGVKCASCKKSALKPHHRFVCLTCRERTGEWLMSGEKEDRRKIKE
ncbi:hypothetical protein PMAYCL1PPCAC_03716, partial [Pristionchus mayeri]